MTTTVNYTVTQISQNAPGGAQGLVLIQWVGVAQNNLCQAVPLAEWADRSVQVSGTFGSGGTVAIQGSNDGTNYYTLNDPLGNAVSKTSAGLSQILELTRWIQPALSSGDGTTNLTISIVGRLCQSSSGWGG